MDPIGSKRLRKVIQLTPRPWKMIRHGDKPASFLGPGNFSASNSLLIFGVSSKICSFFNEGKSWLSTLGFLVFTHGPNWFLLAQISSSMSPCLSLKRVADFTKKVRCNGHWLKTWNLKHPFFHKFVFDWMMIFVQIFKVQIEKWISPSITIHFFNWMSWIPKFQ